MPCSLAPVILFVYNRPEHLKKCIYALSNNYLADQTDLFIYSDGPKNTDDAIKVRQVRDMLRNIKGFKTLNVIESKYNKGLAASVIAGVTEIIEKFEKAIIVEDDLVTSPFFLKFMNEGLNFYENEEKVICIHGYTYPIGKLSHNFFLKGAECWGWATWKRGWVIFEPDGKKLYSELKQKKLEYEFDWQGTYPFKEMLKKQIQGKNDSWAIRWYASAFLKDKLTLYPSRSLVKNIGNDNSGTHSMATDFFDVDISVNNPVEIEQIPVRQEQYILNMLGSYFKNRSMNIFERFKTVFKCTVSQFRNYI